MNAHAVAYAAGFEDEVRAGPERAFWACAVPRLLAMAPGGRMLDLGCGDAQAREHAGDRLEEYVGIDLSPPPGECFAAADLREGLGPTADDPFDLYLASFGVASHLSPDQLTRVLGQIAASARPGAVVAVEALGLHSLEWPRLWDTEPGPARAISYRLGAEVTVHPWAPAELAALFGSCGLEWTGAVDRTVQFGPKLGEGVYWPGLPRLRPALGALLRGDPGHQAELRASLPPLPAHPAARAHQQLAAARRRVLAAGGTPRQIAHRLWALEPHTAAGLGHGLLAVGRLPS